jgi:hypothetical protein
VHLSRVKPHSLSHGRALLESWLTKAITKQERSKLADSAKRFRSDDMQFVKLVAPIEQPVVFWNVPVAADVFAGLNSFPEEEALEKGVCELLCKQLQECDLGVSNRTGNEKGLITLKGLKDGDTVCEVPGILFTSPARVRDFFNIGGNGALAGCPMLEISQLQTAEGGVMSVYMVMVGAARCTERESDH